MLPGDTLVAFSDGVADVQVSSNGRTEPETLADLLLAEGGQATRTADLVLGFADSRPRDDQTVVVIRRNP
jgi:serine phosphatase RsbU (regulator of sigma subunit)